MPLLKINTVKRSLGGSPPGGASPSGARRSFLPEGAVNGDGVDGCGEVLRRRHLTERLRSRVVSAAIKLLHPLFIIHAMIPVVCK